MRYSAHKIICLFYSLIGVLFIFSPSWAVQNLPVGTIIRDAEIEEILHQYADPIFKVAGMNPKDLRIFVMIAPEYNAGAGQQSTLVVTSELLLASDSADEVVGVFGHEIGHMAGGHILRGMDNEWNATKMSILGAVGAAALGVATGRGDVGVAGLMGAQHVATGQFFQYHRAQESAADQAGATFLKRLNWPLQGLKSVMKRLGQQELLSSKQQSSYARTHPWSQDRKAHLERYIAEDKSPALPPAFKNSFEMLQAKLFAFTKTPAQTLRKYPEKNTSTPARYARAIAYFQDGNLPKALSTLETLIQENPQNPYFQELKGQMLFEEGKVKESLGPLKTAHTLDPSAGLVGLLYAQALIEEGSSENLEKADQILIHILKTSDPFPMAWHLRAIIYGKHNNLGMVALSLAEENFMGQNWGEAIEQARRALALLPKGSIGALRAKDILRAAQTESGEKIEPVLKKRKG